MICSKNKALLSTALASTVITTEAEAGFIKDSDVKLYPQMPKHIFNSELRGHESKMTRLHNGLTIGAGIDLKYNKAVGVEALLRAGVKQSIIDKLLKGDKSVRITKQQALDASNYAYAYSRGLLNNRLTRDKKVIDPKTEDIISNLQYWMDIKPNKTKKKLYDKLDKPIALLEYIMNDPSSLMKKARARLNTGGITSSSLKALYKDLIDSSF